MHVIQVDERDSSWEETHPRFRVYLHGSGENETQGWTDTYDITEADILQVIDWAQRQAGDRLTYAVALVADDDSLKSGHARGLVWLVGMDGNDIAGDRVEHVTQRRMLARRGQPVVVPEIDRSPVDVLSPYTDGTRAPD